MYTLGYDLGSSFVKAALMDIGTGSCVASASFPDQEMLIHSSRPGWAEQDPASWWNAIRQVTARLASRSSVPLQSVGAIGISYQMHGLVLVDREGSSLRPSIIWCDSRATEIGRSAFSRIGERRCLGEMLNSPGNFTASKLRWVKENEPDVYGRAYKMLLPGDYIALRMTGEFTTTVSGLSEGILWNFPANTIAKTLMEAYGFRDDLVAQTVPSTGEQGRLTAPAAAELGLTPGTPVTYRAGDQPNNALSLSVLEPGEVAATAGTSGVVYAVTDTLASDPRSRINSFAHINHTPASPRVGILLCINGTGIANSWIRRIASGGALTYDEMNRAASGAPVGSRGIVCLPFGNGAERMLGDRDPGAHILGLNFNVHSAPELFRAVQEGVAFAFVYGIDLMRSLKTSPRILRAGAANMFLSPIFRSTLASTAGVSIELFNTDGAQGAARGAAIGAGAVSAASGAFRGLQRIASVEPDRETGPYRDAYAVWHDRLTSLFLKEG